jgi:NADPH:quinone reductase
MGQKVEKEPLMMNIKTARAVNVSSPGALNCMETCEVEVLPPRPGELLIEVHAAGVNRADVKQRMGNYPMPEGAPSIPGLEVAGVVAAIGPGTSGWKTGDEVCALLIGGGYSEYCIAPVQQCLRLPRGMDMVCAAGLPETVFTVWTALFEQATLRPRETVLIHGGASGIGTTAIQLAAAFGSRPMATAGSESRCELCIRLGAELAVNYRTHDFVDAVLSHTEGRGADVILDMVGGSYGPRNLKTLAHSGRLCFIAGDSEPEVNFNVREIILKRATITGSTLRHRSVEDKGRVAAEIQRRVWPLISEGRFAPVIHAVVPLDQAATAHEMLMRGEVAGKVVLKVR